MEDFTDSSRSNEPASNAAALAAAKAARLRYVSDHGPGIARHRFGKEFEYRDPRTLRGRDLTRKPLEERREILPGLYTLSRRFATTPSNPCSRNASINSAGEASIASE